MKKKNTYQSIVSSSNQRDPFYSIKQYTYVNEGLTKQYILHLLSARNFFVPETQYTDFMDNQKKLGNDLLNHKLPDFLREHLPDSEKVLEKIASQEPYLWTRLNNAISFGYYLGMHLHDIRMGAKNTLQSVAFSSALFNSGIALFDYIIDELAEGHIIFDHINENYLHDIKKHSVRPLSALNSEGSFGLIIKLLFILVDVFFISIQKLYSNSRNDEQWQILCNTLSKLFIAEKITTSIDITSVLENQDNFETISYKSVMPFVVFNIISRLTTDPVPGKPENEVENLCRLIGNIFWITDDLSDIAVDIKKNVPGYITKKMIHICCDSSRELSIKLAIGEAINDLLTLYDEIDNYSNNERLSQKAVIDLRIFIGMYIYSWLSE